MWRPLIILLTLYIGLCQSLLYPRQTSTRDVRRLDGIWKFRVCPMDYPDKGFDDQWFARDWDQTSVPYELIAVPASYNDVFQDSAVRDHVGYVWYQRNFVIPPGWKDQRIVLYFASVNYYAVVFVNGKRVTNHELGHLPFEVDVDQFVQLSAENVLTVAVNNTLTMSTLPQGSLTLKINHTNYPPFYYKNDGNFDFFNYAGIHRGVFLYTTNRQYIKDIVIKTPLVCKKESAVTFNISVEDVGRNTSCIVSIYNKENVKLNTIKTCAFSATLKDVILWWPYTYTAETPGYQYKLLASLYVGTRIIDDYPMKFGIREFKLENDTTLVNGKQFYFAGLGKHEDGDVRGRGLDLPMIVKDLNLIKWLGANSFRTSHYPYSEEIMDMCDELGIVVINECPAVGLEKFDSAVLRLHKTAMDELISRDKNRPSVFLWSIANEPRSNLPESEKYFSELVASLRRENSGLLLTAAINENPSTNLLAQHLDVIMVNKYVSWYSDAGSLEVVEKQVVNAVTGWIAKYKKPVMISEYGADTVSGLHSSPASMFSEDYQTELLIKHHRAFDTLRLRGYFIGEHVWNFADFMTAQGITRVMGNRKGIFTRNRQPKASAKIIRCRYHRIQNLSTDHEDDAYLCPVQRLRRIKNEL